MIINETLVKIVFVEVLTIFLAKTILHYRYLHKTGRDIYIPIISTFYSKEKARRYNLFFLASIMIPIISQNKLVGGRNVINALVIVFYVSLVIFFILLSHLSE